MIDSLFQKYGNNREVIPLYLFLNDNSSSFSAQFEAKKLYYEKQAV